MTDARNARLRELLAAASPLVVPGAADALSARVAVAAGFEAVYLTGAGLTNSYLGAPDVGLVSLSQLADHTEALRMAVDVPLIVDADTGFGGPLNVHRAVQVLERRGANAVQLEDQTFPKRCGHFEGKQVIPAADMVAKIHAALDARDDDRLTIIARTDARAVHGLAEALDRAHAYHEAGADVLFVEAPQAVEEIARIGASLPGPLLVNMVEGGRTPLLPADRLGALGFSCVLYANAALRAAVYGMRGVLTHLRKYGTTEEVQAQMISWQERQDLVGKPAFDELEARYASPPPNRTSA